MAVAGHARDGPPVLVLERLGERVVVYFELRHFHALVGGDSDEGRLWHGYDGRHDAVSRQYHHLHHVLVHRVEENLDVM